MSLKVSDDCYGCGACKFSCPTHAITPVADYKARYTINPILCNDCGLCIPMCPVDALVPDNGFAVCHGRGCPMISSRLYGWECSEGTLLCPTCSAVLWKPPAGKSFCCPRCDLGMKVICPKTRRLETTRAA